MFLWRPLGGDDVSCFFQEYQWHGLQIVQISIQLKSLNGNLKRIVKDEAPNGKADQEQQ